MKIINSVYQSIINSCCSVNHESGGIIGGNKDLINIYVFDSGKKDKSFGCYIPDTALLNNCLSDWTKSNISFYGIFHSHFQGCEELSGNDKLYINNIMSAMPDDACSLLFPIVFPLKHKIVFFLADKTEENITITKYNVEIV